ncbi:MAG: TraR/DksA family transcriptional regulator [Spirochaetaceae bacterium]
MRVQLDSKKKDVVDLLASEYSAFQETNNASGRDLVDLASNDFEKQILDVSSALEVKTLNKINAAINRMQNGHYGVCAQCSEHINQDRLKAMPYAVLCVKCKTKRERFPNN